MLKLKREVTHPTDRSIPWLAVALVAAGIASFAFKLAVCLLRSSAAPELPHAIETTDGDVLFNTQDPTIEATTSYAMHPPARDLGRCIGGYTQIDHIRCLEMQVGRTIARDKPAAPTTYEMHSKSVPAIAECGGPGAELHAVGVPSPWRAFVVTPGALADTSGYGITVNTSCRVNFAVPYMDTPDCVATSIPLDPDAAAPDLSLSYRFTTTSITLSTRPGYRYLVTCKASR
jgi:hypothetical protein